MKGKFIVIDGTDGSGKATQSRELIKKLEKEGREVRTIDFPQYEKNFFGKFIGECLTGEHGDFAKLNPKVASTLYAADRFESSKEIKKWINEGFIVIADRYASSNQIHQGGKIKDSKKRKEFLDWLEKMEFEVFEIPKPDAVIYLSVPLEVSGKLLKNEGNKEKKKYLNGKEDLVENNLDYMENSKASAVKMLEETNNWVEINCIENDKLRSIEDIGNEIYENVVNILEK
jgi:dTMP kinase